MCLYLDLQIEFHPCNYFDIEFVFVLQPSLSSRDSGSPARQASLPVISILGSLDSRGSGIPACHSILSPTAFALREDLAPPDRRTTDRSLCAPGPLQKNPRSWVLNDTNGAARKRLKLSGAAQFPVQNPPAAFPRERAPHHRPLPRRAPTVAEKLTIVGSE